MNVTGEQVRIAAIAQGERRIPHHRCSLCGKCVCYEIVGDYLYFDPSCDCGDSPLEARSWSSAADWINMQTHDNSQRNIAGRFGLALPATPSNPEGTET